MPLQGGVRVTGLAEVVRELRSVGADLDDLKDVFAGIAEKGARLASTFAPKRSGRLAASVRGNRAKNKAVVTAGRGSVPYAGPINYGWPRRNIRASGFMQQADEQLRDEAVRDLTRGIEDVIRKAGLS